MNAERLIELAALNAVGAVEGADLAEFNALLKTTSPAQKLEIARLRDAAALVAMAGIAPQRPPAALKAKLMARVENRTRLPKDIFANPFYFIGANEGQWQTLPIPGVRAKDLAEDKQRGVSVKLYELAPGTHFPGHHHSGPEQCFVVSGDFHVEGRVLHAGDFHHAEPDTDHGESHTVGGCLLLVMVTTDDYK